MDEKNEDKIKRLSFVENEDIYFLLYCILIMLNELGYKTEEKSFYDYKKIAFISLIMSSDKYFNYFCEYYGSNKKINKSIKKDLEIFYLKGIQNIEKLKLILVIMENKGIIEIVKNKNRTDIYLKNDENIKTVFSELFIKETHNISAINKKENRLRTVSYKIFLEKLFPNGVIETWDI